MRFLLWFALFLSAACSLAQQSSPPSPPPAPPSATAASPAVAPEPEAPAPAAASTTDPAPATVPDVHSQSAQAPSVDPAKQQPKRILGVVPNFRAVSAGAIPPPPTTKQSFVLATQNSFDYSSFVFVGITSAMAEGTNTHPELGKGMEGFGNYYWRGFVDKTDGNYWVLFILPTLLHEDERYFAMGEGGFWKRGFYAASRVFVARDYHGKNTFNVSELLGRGIAQGISTTYYPSGDNVGEQLIVKYAYALGRDALTNVFREFWPDIAKHVLHRHP